SGQLVAFGDRLVRDLRGRIAQRQARISPAEAVADAAAHLGLPAAARLAPTRSPGGPSRQIVFDGGGISRDEIPVKLEYVPRPDADVRLAWNVVIRTPDGRHWWNLHVDAVDGSVLRQDDWIAHDSYRVFPPPVVSPDDGPRSLVTSPADPLASPLGW